MTKEEYQALNKEPEDYIESNEEFAAQVEEWKKEDAEGLTEPAYYEYAIKHHARKKAKFDELRAKKIEALKEYVRLNPEDESLIKIDKLTSMNPIAIDRLYAFYCYEGGEDAQFWDVLEMPPWQYGPFSNERGAVHLIASDPWGGGRTKFEWHISTDTSGCFDIDIPTHFCGGTDDLENIILALVDARNIMAKHYPRNKSGWYYNQDKTWEINEINDEHKDEPKNDEL